jgi:hypothetical protein
MKPMTTRIHGMLDYLSVGVLLALPRVFHWRKEPTRLLTASALSTLVYSLLTRYEWGLARCCRSRPTWHWTQPVGSFCVAHRCCLPQTDRRVSATLIGLGLFEIIVPALTQSAPEQRSRELGMPE